jgi:outer membrane receptor protein involved in Fe transport
VGLYVDNIPYLDKGMYDFDFHDLAGIEVLRGPQGALYGRNTMGGIINIYTPSALMQQGLAFRLSYGDRNVLRSTLSYSHKPGANTGIMAGMSYQRSDGFFSNRFTQAPAGALLSFGLRLRVDWIINNHWQLNYTVSGESGRQDGYPYGLASAGGHAGDSISYNDESSYRRQWLVNSLHLQYRGAGYTVKSVTSYQYLDDDMKMDQDFRPDNFFTLEQLQHQHAFTQEIVAQSDGTDAYQWLLGVFGFYKGLTTDAPVTLKKDFFNQLVFSKMPAGIELQAADDCRSYGRYKTPSSGVSIFHQSRLRPFLFSRLTAAVGLRADCEKVTIDHINYAHDFPVRGVDDREPPASPRTEPYRVGVNISGADAQSFFQFSPNFTLNYELAAGSRIYASVSRGYRAGGYNFQLFSDVLQSELTALVREGITQTRDTTVSGELIAYRPEYSWNYEAGARTTFFQDRVQIALSFFYIDSRDQQVTDFVASGLGRITKNVGRSQSRGAEASLTGTFGNFAAAANYGYTHATFYHGNYIPFVPKHTLSVGAEYAFRLRPGWLDRLIVSAQYTGLGKIYFTEENDASQDFYSLLDASVTVEKDDFALTLWGKNMTNTIYNLFYFHGINNKSFAQQGLPLHFGVTLRKRV